MLQLGAIASLTSAIHQLRPSVWIGTQVIIGAMILAFLGVGPLTPPRVFASCRHLLSALRTFVSELSPWGGTALMLILGMLVLSAITQIATPIHAGDEKMYHASRVIYWIQNQSVFPYVTHNDRQNITPFGSELFFLWPVLLTKTEWIGRLVFWLAYPCAAIGQYVLLRTVRLSITAALVGVLILITTPLVAASAIGLKPELWSILTLLGSSYWLVSVGLDPRDLQAKCFLLGVFTMLSMNMRPFALLMVPGVVFVSLMARSTVVWLARVKALGAGLACGCLLSSLAIPLAFNLAHYRHPLGPAAARYVVVADVSPRQIYTHVVRFAIGLLEWPDVPMPVETRARVDALTNHLIAAVGADTPLPLETTARWPGMFSYSLPEHATGFSLWGVLWIPTLVIAGVLLIRNVWATWPTVGLTAIPAQSLIALPVLAAILVGARWMVEAQVPTRYLLAPYALTLPIGVALAASFLKERRLAASLFVIAIAVSVYQPMRSQFYDAVHAIAAPLTDRDINQGFEEALDLVPHRSRILFVGDADAPDYPLFSPGTRYGNTVIPWGKTPFDPVRMRSLIDSQRVTHVLIQHDERALLQWEPNLPTAGMVAWLAGEPELNEITLGTPHMRLFETSHSPERYERPYQTTAVPASAPLITIGPTLHQRVGLDPLFLRTAWAVEGSKSGGYLWMGQGREDGLGFGLWSREQRIVDLQFDLAAGPSLTTPARMLMLLLNGALVRDQEFQRTATIVFRVTLRPGRNLVEFVALDAPNVLSQPNGDPRKLMVLLRSVRVESTPAEAGRVADDGSGDDLAHAARRAAAAVISKQQIPGYWVTAYTSGPSFGRPQFEMNTYLTSMMIDVLEPAAAATGLAESVQRARHHLAEQIEPGGLVRYHGRADATTIGSLGCVITPDADDTALIWRIAPSTRRDLLPPALETLARFRTTDGLYRTWLAPVAQYQCLDPGSDPDPADATINMHVLMFLAKVDPAAAGALCSALRRTIDEDRIWVYYRQAPLVPVLRQTDMDQHGCALPLPSSRTRAVSPEQEVWVGAARLWQRMVSVQNELPTSAEVISLVRRLSNDDFAFVRQFPPLMYHNDLSAHVPRFYWSDDFGYALWLRLYAEGERHGLLHRGDPR